MTRSEEGANNQPARLKDVAKLAGVSIATASRALNGAGLVGSETQQRVVQAAETLLYVPDQEARSLALRRTL